MFVIENSAVELVGLLSHNNGGGTGQVVAVMLIYSKYKKTFSSPTEHSNLHDNYSINNFTKVETHTHTLTHRQPQPQQQKTNQTNAFSSCNPSNAWVVA